MVSGCSKPDGCSFGCNLEGAPAAPYGSQLLASVASLATFMQSRLDFVLTFYHCTIKQLHYGHIALLRADKPYLILQPKNASIGDTLLQDYTLLGALDHTRPLIKDKMCADFNLGEPRVPCTGMIH
jgi:hypothetical protein